MENLSTTRTEVIFHMKLANPLKINFIKIYLLFNVDNQGFEE